MVIPLLSTKLHIPSPPADLVPRARLIEQLDAGVRQKFILISAPAGFGKTALVAEWAAQRISKNLISWVHLDEHDNEPVRFLTYIIAALQTHHLDIGEAALAGLQSVPPAPIEATLASLINEIDSIETHLTLVFDDYHQIDQPAIHKAVDFLLQHLPTAMSLVITTRTDPPLPLHRLRAQGEMMELRAADLRFTQEESQRFLARNLERPLSKAELTALESRIEGWAAGLQMMGISLQGRQDIQAFIASFSGSHRYIMDYLTEEIYNQQPPHIQQFLLRTSILDRLSGSLCDFMLAKEHVELTEGAETPAAQDILEYLERANLFLHPLDDDRIWYRYHNLFAGLLRQRLRLAQPQEIQRLQTRASEWSAANGSFEEAFQYALAADNLDAAARIVADQGLDLLKKGATATLLRWFDKLPAEVIQGQPRLNVIYAWGLLLSGEAVDLEIYLEAAEEKQARSRDIDELQGEIAAIRAYAATRRGDIAQTLEQANQAFTMLPTDDYSIRSVVSFVVGGIYYMQQDLPEAYAAMKEASEGGVRSGNVHVAVSALNAMAGILVKQGQLAAAEETYARALVLGTTRSGQPLPISASIYEGFARLHLARGNLQKARDFAQIGIALSEKWASPDNQIHSLLALAQIAQLEGNTLEAHQSMERVRQLAAAHILIPDTEASIAAFQEQLPTPRAGSLHQDHLVEQLTEREREVLRLIADGHSNQEIATALIIALGTVKAHTSSIYRKLDVRGRTEAVIKARDLRLF